MPTDTTRRKTDLVALPIELFADHIDLALEAFGRDVSYAVAIAKAAVTITRKREQWQQRREPGKA